MEAACVIIVLASLIAWIWTKHPFFCLPLLVAGSLLLEDDSYPFSHFPMYSDPDESENYLYLAEPTDDGGLKALPVRALTGLTAPKIKKMYKTYLEDHADASGKRHDELSAQELDEIGQQILTYYRDQGEKRGSTMPDTLVLMEVWIEFDNEKAGFTETTTELARQSSTPAVQP